MGLLDFFKRKNNAVTPSVNKEHPDISTTEKFLTVRSINFFGPYSSSPNGEYMLGRQDSDYQGNGRSVLVQGNRLLYQVDTRAIIQWL